MAVTIEKHRVECEADGRVVEVCFGADGSYRIRIQEKRPMAIIGGFIPGNNSWKNVTLAPWEGV